MGYSIGTATMHARRKCLPMWPRRCGTQRLLVTAKLSCVVSRSSDAGRKALSSGLELTLWPLYTLYKHIHAFNIMQNKVGTYACLQQASYKMHCVTVNVTNTNTLLHTYNESTDFILNSVTLSFKANKITYGNVCRLQQYSNSSGSLVKLICR